MSWAKPGFGCKWCSYRDICEEAIRGCKLEKTDHFFNWLTY